MCWYFFVWEMSIFNFWRFTGWFNYIKDFTKRSGSKKQAVISSAKYILIFISYNFTNSNPPLPCFYDCLEGNMWLFGGTNLFTFSGFTHMLKIVKVRTHLSWINLRINHCAKVSFLAQHTIFFFNFKWCIYRVLF